MIRSRLIKNRHKFDLKGLSIKSKKIKNNFKERKHMELHINRDYFKLLEKFYNNTDDNIIKMGISLEKYYYIKINSRTNWKTEKSQ